jgi:murein DD-endopeptidase MepM/ murein hydrolase activator NlpD
VSKQERRAPARLRSGTPLIVVAAALAGVLVAVLGASLFAATARAVPPRRVLAPAPRSTFLAERALASEVAGPAAVVEGTAQSGGALFAPQPGSGDWYWPTGTEDFGSYAGFLAPRGAYVHVAQDMRSPEGHPVFAVGAGTVCISRADAGGYGVGGAPGGCMIIVHRTAAGEEFRALYGHISELKYKAGAHVPAGAVIATVNGCAHLHFSIHPSAVYRDGNPYAGHVPKSWADHGGFVDPVAYLNANPRAVTYAAPALPVVRITTSVAPSRFGAAAGSAYWDEGAGDGAATFAYDLLAGTRRQLSPGETVPPFDEVRYALRALTAPALGIAVRDRQPVLAVEAHPLTPAWGAAAHLTATVTNAAARPFKGARVVLERLAGTAWSRIVAGVTDGEGRVAFDYTPALRSVLRVQFLLPAVQPEQATYVPVEAAVVTVAPKVRLSLPEVPAVVARGGALTVTGSLTPRHAPGKGSVRLEFQRLTLAGDWEVALTAAATLSDAGESSRYSAVIKLDDAGAWRVRAVHPDDAAHAATHGEWRAFVVK